MCLFNCSASYTVWPVLCLFALFSSHSHLPVCTKQLLQTVGHMCQSAHSSSTCTSTLCNNLLLMTNCDFLHFPLEVLRSFHLKEGQTGTLWFRFCFHQVWKKKKRNRGQNLFAHTSSRSNFEMTYEKQLWLISLLTERALAKSNWTKTYGGIGPTL